MLFSFQRPSFIPRSENITLESSPDRRGVAKTSVLRSRERVLPPPLRCVKPSDSFEVAKTSVPRQRERVTTSAPPLRQEIYARSPSAGAAPFPREASSRPTQRYVSPNLSTNLGQSPQPTRTRLRPGERPPHVCAHEASRPAPHHIAGAPSCCRPAVTMRPRPGRDQSGFSPTSPGPANRNFFRPGAATRRGHACDGPA